MLSLGNPVRWTRWDKFKLPFSRPGGALRPGHSLPVFSPSSMCSRRAWCMSWGRPRTGSITVNLMSTWATASSSQSSLGPGRPTASFIWWNWQGSNTSTVKDKSSWERKALSLPSRPIKEFFECFVDQWCRSDVCCPLCKEGTQLTKLLPSSLIHELGWVGELGPDEGMSFLGKSLVLN